MHLKRSSAKWRPFCPGGDELKAHDDNHLAHPISPFAGMTEEELLTQIGIFVAASLCGNGEMRYYTWIIEKRDDNMYHDVQSPNISKNLPTISWNDPEFRRWLAKKIVDLHRADPWLHSAHWVSSKAANALAAIVSRPSAAMLLTGSCIALV